MKQGKFKIIIDSDTCISCGNCVEIAPKIFKFNKQMKSRVRGNPVIDKKVLMTAVRNCPVTAITVIDAKTGKKLRPN